MLPRLPLRTALAVASALLLPPVLLPATAGAAVPGADQRAVAGGRLDWGIKASFQTYVTGPVAQGGWSLSDGATTVGADQFRFHSAAGDYAPETGQLTARYTGGVHFTGHRGADGEHELDLTLSSPTVRISGGAGTLHADLRSRDRASGEFTEATQVPLAALDLSGAALGDAPTLALTDVPATLTAEGATAFGGFYAAGDPLDPLTLTADTQAPADPDPEPAEEPTEREPAADEPGAVADAAVDWGVRRTFREYVTGPVAEGAWELADGARDGGALFRFPDGAGTADPEAGTLDLRFAGALRFTGTDLDLALDGVTVSVADGTGTLSADVTAEGTTRRDRPLVTFPAEDLAPVDGLIHLPEAPAELTEEGADAFGELYQPGTAMDPVSLAVAVDPAAELPALPDLGSEPPAAQPPDEDADGGADDGTDAAASPDSPSGASATSRIALAAAAAGTVLTAAAGYLTLRRRRRPRE